MMNKLDNLESTRLKRDINIALKNIEEFLERGHPDFRTFTEHQAKDFYSIKEQLIWKAWNRLKDF